jgi:hypothetical protein
VTKGRHVSAQYSHQLAVFIRNKPSKDRAPSVEYAEKLLTSPGECYFARLNEDRKASEQNFKKVKQNSAAKMPFEIEDINDNDNRGYNNDNTETCTDSINRRGESSSAASTMDRKTMLAAPRSKPLGPLEYSWSIEEMTS